MEMYDYYEFVESPYASAILDHIVLCNDVGAKDYTYIICGHSGPTGKTWLANELKERGYKTIEISESMFGLVYYTDHHNHFIVNGKEKAVLIVLNKSLDR